MRVSPGFNVARGMELVDATTGKGANILERALRSRDAYVRCCSRPGPSLQGHDRLVPSDANVLRDWVIQEMGR